LQAPSASLQLKASPFRSGRRSGGSREDELIVVHAGGVYVVGTALDGWHVASADVARRFSAAFLGVEEEKYKTRARQVVCAVLWPA